MKVRDPLIHEEVNLELGKMVSSYQSPRTPAAAPAAPVVALSQRPLKLPPKISHPHTEPQQPKKISAEKPELLPVVHEPGQSLASVTPSNSSATAPLDKLQKPHLQKLNSLDSSGVKLSSSSETPVIFDIPVTYNRRVSHWIRYFQTEGRRTFRNWLERSSRYMPILQFELARAGLPQDLVYVAMVESGFQSNATSNMSAMGIWQFIDPTARRYGLQIDWWLDERRDFFKSTEAAISYMSDLYQQFGSWYLVAASYNMGETGVRRLIERHRTHNFWELAERGALPQETTDYVPKIIAAMLISKAPALYGFRNLNYEMPLTFENVRAPGGTDLTNLANYLGVSGKYLRDLNPELIKGFIPREVTGYRIRVPKGSTLTVSQYIRMQNGGEAN
jgi:membrane-bound lytic murein transglycosylase D